MKKMQIPKLIVLCLLIVGMAFSGYGCSWGGVSDANAVLNAYEKFALSEPELFNAAANYSFHVAFEENVQKAVDGLDANGAPCDSHFTVLSKMYEPMAVYALSMFNNNRNLLKTQNANISNKLANDLNGKFIEFKTACKDLVTAKKGLDYWGDTILNGNTVFESTIHLGRLDEVKHAYGIVIQKGFAMNNKFLEIYDSIIPSPDFVNDSEAVLVDGNLQLAYDHYTSEVLDVAFEIDGVQFAFYNRNAESTNKIYSSTLNKVLESITAYGQIAEDKKVVSAYSAEKLAAVQEAFRLYQINLNAYKNLKGTFLKIAGDVNYVEYEKALAEGKTTAEYVLSLEGNDAAKFSMVNNFISTSFVNVIESFKEIIAAVNA